MAYTYSEKLVSSSKYSIKCPYSMTPKYITIHNTYNDAAAVNEVSYMVGSGTQTSYHLAVDDKHVVLGIPLNRNAWHAGDGGSGTGNRQSIGIEICYSKSGGAKYTAAEENAVLLAAKLLHTYGLSINALRKHQDWSGKNCPHRILAEKRWDSFKKRVEDAMNDIKGGRMSGSMKVGSAPANTSKPTPSSSFKIGTYDKYVKVQSADGLNVRAKRNAEGTKLGTLKNGTVVKVNYIMYENDKTTGDTLWGSISFNGKTGFINLTYVVATSAPASAAAVITTGKASTFKVGTCDRKVRVINCDKLNVRAKRDFDSTVVATIPAGSIVEVGYIMYENNKTTGSVLMGGVYVNGKQGFISMKYCQFI